MTRSADKRYSSYRYPHEVANVDELATEIVCADRDHGRRGVCGWYLMWLDPRKLVLWDEAAKVIEGEYGPKHKTAREAASS